MRIDSRKIHANLAIKRIVIAKFGKPNQKSQKNCHCEEVRRTDEAIYFGDS